MGFPMKVALEAARDWLEAGLAFFYPEVCQLCGEARATRPQGYVCARCRENVRFVKRPFCERCGRSFPGAITTIFQCGSCRGTELYFTSARSAVLARGKVLEAIHRYKYNRALWVEPFLASLLVEAATPELAREHWDWLVPVPLHPTRLREREFNQAQRLAQCLSKTTRIPVNTRLVRRVLPTPKQTLLSREERLENVRNAFALAPGVGLKGKRLVLLDDVFTTGATTSACARVLRKAGAEDVCVWTLARGL
jgi:competence protein ComFC